MTMIVKVLKMIVKKVESYRGQASQGGRRRRWQQEGGRRWGCCNTNLFFQFLFQFLYFIFAGRGETVRLLNQKKYFHFYWHLYISYLKGKRWGCLSTIYTVNFPFIFKLPLENTLQSGAILETLIGVRWKERKARELMSSEASKSTCWRSYR